MTDASLPALPPHVEWVLPRARQPHVRLAHVRVGALEVTLCGRTRPGEPLVPADIITDELTPCDRCLFRARDLWD